MKFPILALLIALSPVTALAAGTESSDVSSNPLQKSKSEAVSAQGGPCAAPDKMLRWACVKKPVTSVSTDSVGSDDLKKIVKITPLVKPSGLRTVDAQAKPVKTLKPVTASGQKPMPCDTLRWHKPGLKT